MLKFNQWKSDAYLIVHGNNQLITYDLTKSNILFTEKNVKKFTTLPNFVLSSNNNQIKIYNIQKKKDITINFQHYVTMRLQV